MSEERQRKKRRYAYLRETPAQKIAVLVKLLASGATMAAACSAVGIRPVSIKKWLTVGKKHFKARAKSRFAELYYEVMKAKGTARCSAEHRVWKGDPKWWLSRGEYRDDWTMAPKRVDVKKLMAGLVRHEHEHQHQIEETIEQNVNVNVETTHTFAIEGIPNDLAEQGIAEALVYLEELGLVSRTEEGKKVFLVEKKVNTSGETDEIPNEDEDEDRPENYGKSL